VSPAPPEVSPRGDTFAPMPRGFRCHSCAAWHDELPLVFAFDEPIYEHTHAVTEDLRELLQGDPHYFIRGEIEIPIIGGDWFRYVVWASLSAHSYEAASRQRDAGPFFGWLSNQLPGYPDTLNLKTRVHLRAGARAAIELEPTQHPLAVEQREGITMERVEQIAARAVHAL
jgi:hypothetical protein